MKVLLYCTMAKPYLYHFESEKRQGDNDYYKTFDYKKGFRMFDKIQKKHSFREGDLYVALDHMLNGKIVAECDCDKIELFTADYRGNDNQNERISKDSCLSFSDLINYQGDNQFLYALHLSNVNVFDKPKYLIDYMKKNQSYRLYKYKRLYNAPQNMMTIYDNEENEYILVSIRSEWLYKILNGEKTIEVRRKILNCMKELILNASN